jgi:hypothetical protein
MRRTALMVDRNGVLNAASLDVSSGEGWQGHVYAAASNLRGAV